jgi:ATP-binding cassette subfamily B protein
MILGRIIDQYVLNPAQLPAAHLVRGALGWLLVALAVALVARLASTVQSYLLQFIVQSAGMQLFNDGLRKTLRLS